MGEKRSSRSSETWNLFEASRPCLATNWKKEEDQKGEREEEKMHIGRLEEKKFQGRNLKAVLLTWREGRVSAGDESTVKGKKPEWQRRALGKGGTRERSFWTVVREADNNTFSRKTRTHSGEEAVHRAGKISPWGLGEGCVAEGVYERSSRSLQENGLGNPKKKKKKKKQTHGLKAGRKKLSAYKTSAGGGHRRS